MTRRSPGSGLIAVADRASDRTTIAAVALLGLVVRIVYWAGFTADRPLLSDAGQYHFLASNIAEGRGFVDTFPQFELHATAFRPPAYPGLLGLVYTILWPSPGIGRALNVAIGVAVIALLTGLVMARLGRRAGVAAGLACALLPNIVANDTYVLTEPLSLLLILALLALFTSDRWAAAGVVAGLLVLTRPSAQLLVPILVLVAWRRIGWRRGLAFGAIAVLIVAPWVVRNWIQLGSPVLVTSNGFNYAALYSPAADEAGRFIDPVVHPAFDDARFDQFDEVTWDRNLRRTAVDHVRERPAVVPEVVRRNAAAWYEVRPEYNEIAEWLDGRHEGIRRWTYWLVWPVTALGAWGAWRSRREPLVAMAAIVAAYFTLASLVFVAPPRLRTPVDLLLVLCAASLLRPRPAEEGGPGG